MDRWTNGQTDQRMDRVMDRGNTSSNSYWDARTHLKVKWYKKEEEEEEEEEESEKEEQGKEEGEEGKEGDKVTGTQPKLAKRLKPS